MLCDYINLVSHTLCILYNHNKHFKNRLFCNVSYAYGVSSVYTMFIHFMTYPESFCLIKLTSSESSTITNEKCLSYIYQINQFKTSRAHNTDRVHNCRVKAVFIENDVKHYQLCL